MKKIISLFGKKFNIPKIDGTLSVISSLSLTEKLIFGIATLIFIGASLSMLIRVNQNFLVEIPREGGTYNEGIIGTPRFINPILALSETDRDLTSLIYSGLMRQAPNGDLIPDLAESFEISEDQTSYTFKIKEDAVFHDNKPVTADDVVFTITNAQDPGIKSPKRANWDGIVVEKISDKEVVFHLQQPYAPFLNNTTLGILPRHLWQGVSIEEFSFSNLNRQPIGSGPYKIKDVINDKSGITKTYKLISFEDFTIGKPYIKNINISFYRNEEGIIIALKDKEIESVNGVSPETAKQFIDSLEIRKIPLPRIFAIFFNQSKAPLFIQDPVRVALDTAIDRKKIIDTVLSGFGKEINGPIPEHLIQIDQAENNTEAPEDKIEKAKSILNNAGWSLNEKGIMEKKTKNGSETLTFSISTADIPELISVAEQVTETWKSIGADVSVKIFNANDLNQNIIRPRKYDSLLFGQIISRDLDFYAFWHSSQRSDPGLNVADYANITIDKILEEARSLSDAEERNEVLKKFDAEIKKDTPAVFLYSPDFIYIVPKKLKGEIPTNITVPSDRFSNIHQWYLETDTVWRIFNR